MVYRPDISPYALPSFRQIVRLYELMDQLSLHTDTVTVHYVCGTRMIRLSGDGFHGTGAQA